MAIRDIIKNERKTIILIYSYEKNMTYININISTDLMNVNANDIIVHLRKYIEIKGGGKHNTANGIITQINHNIKHILEYIYTYINNIK